MARCTILFASISEVTPTRLEIATTMSMGGHRFNQVGILLGGGLVMIMMGLVGNDGKMIAAAGTLCLLPALVLLLTIPATVKAVIDPQAQTMTLTRVPLIGVGQWPPQHEQTISFLSIAEVKYRTDWLRLFHRVEVFTTDNLKIRLRFESDRAGARLAATTISKWVGRSPEPGDGIGADEYPDSGWRKGLRAALQLLDALGRFF